MARRLQILLTLVACAGIARAQTGELELLDAGIEDVNPFGVSTRVEPIELRSPSAFEHVYRAADGKGFVRISGAIVAEFFRSEYVRTQYGDYPVRPAGTVFYIGAREGQLTATPQREHTSALQVSGRVTGRIEGGATPLGVESHETPSQRTGRPRPTVWTDEAYRQSRMTRAIARAVDSSR